MYFWDKHKTITTYYELLSGEVCDRYGLTQMEYDILMFLHNNPQHNTAAEIVKIRKSTKSHVSTSLKDLENKGLIRKIQSEDNKKHVKEKTFAKKDKKEVKETKEVTEKEEIKEEKPELDLNILTVAELRDLAKKKEIKGYSKMKKEELIENLK